MKKILIFLLIVLQGFSYTNAQSLGAAITHYNDFVSFYSAGGESVDAYSALYRSYVGFMSAISAYPKGSDEWMQAKEGLKNAYPHLYNGAYYFTSRGDNKNTANFVEAYISISICSAMDGENLEKGDDYGTFAWMAATKAYNTKEFAKAILFLNAYINSGDVQRRADAYNFIAKAYTYLDDKAHAKYILQQGLALYPDNMSMLVSIINMLAESKDDDVTLQKYVSDALILKPNEEGLLNIQAQLYERNAKFEDAIVYYNKLKLMKPNSLEIARHLAVNYYNSGVVYVEKATAIEQNAKERKRRKDELKIYRQKANENLNSASVIMTQVLHDDPLAVQYAYALANAYLYLGEREQLADINDKLAALGVKPVEDLSTMKMMAYNKSTASQDLVFSTGANVAYNNAAPQKQVPASMNNADNGASQAAVTTRTEELAEGISDVDVNIPETGIVNDNMLVLLIANEDYTRVAKVPNAKHDGEVFAEYCHKVLGVPEHNIRKYFNTTYAGMLDAIYDIKDLVQLKGENCSLIVYYAGHGVPDEKTKSAYILPVDSNGKNTQVCYSLNKLYDELAALNTACTTVFLDACFSGATRKDGEMLMSARSIAIDVDENEIDGKLVVFSAASGDQTALSYDDKHHGMFTYFLLKKLKDTAGDVDLHTLGSYIAENVALQARLVNRKEQIPTVVPGYGFGEEWKTLKLK